MEKRVVEPVVRGIEGRLEITPDGGFFEGRKIRRHLFGREKVELESVLRAGDVLEGWVQLFRGWTAQPEVLVEDWLENEGNLDDRLVRCVFRVGDYRRLELIGQRGERLFERKNELEQYVPDCIWLQKNPFFLVPESRMEEFLKIQPPGSHWLVEGEQREQCSGVGFEKNRKWNGLDLQVAGGWLDLEQVQQEMDAVRASGRQASEKLNTTLEEVKRLKREQERLTPLVAAGERYLESMKEEGVRCLDALGLAGKKEMETCLWEELFDGSVPVPVERIEQRLRVFQNRLAQLYPTEPVGRSTELPGIELKKELKAESYRLGGVLPRES